MPVDTPIGEWRRLLRPLRRFAERAYDALGAQVLNRGRVAVCDVRGHAIKIVTESDLERFRARSYGTKEPETLDWIERYFRAGDVMYDVGANIGLYSLFAARRLDGQCRVYAFEPEALNYADLNRNIHLNGLSGTVIPCCLAITDALRFDRFFLNPSDAVAGNGDGGLVPGSALHTFGVAEDFRHRAFAAVHQQGMVGVHIDHLWSAWGLDFPNHIKIDVDGLEARVVAGASQTLADGRLKSALVEISADSVHERQIVETLLAAGLTEVRDFAAHSADALVGTDYEGCLNRVFVRTR